MIFAKAIAEAPLIKNQPQSRNKGDFAINVVGALLVLIALAIAAGIAAMFTSTFDELGFAALVAGPVVATAVFAVFPRWIAVFVAIALEAALVAGAKTLGASLRNVGILMPIVAVATAFMPSIQKLREWERAIVLRLGKFHKVRGPGLFFLAPFADQVADHVDLRIRVTDFAAETTLTKDSVTVTVDALCFWLVWDPEKAICEVQNYVEAVVLSSQTALREAISKHDLSTFLERGDVIEEAIREEVDKKTTEWGITVQHIEITDIQIPDALQDSLSRLAQAEREKKGRILLAEAEIEIANRLETASRIYGENQIALKLKSLSILNEGLKAGSSMMLVPNSITEELRTKDVFGLEALNETRKAPRADGGASEEKNGDR